MSVIPPRYQPLTIPVICKPTIVIATSTKDLYTLEVDIVVDIPVMVVIVTIDDDSVVSVINIVIDVVIIVMVIIHQLRVRRGRIVQPYI